MLQLLSSLLQSYFHNLFHLSCKTLCKFVYIHLPLVIGVIICYIFVRWACSDNISDKLRPACYSRSNAHKQHLDVI